jgi:hypothetical protein
VVFKDPSGRAVLSYTGLKVHDASGRALPADLSVSGEGPFSVFGWIRRLLHRVPF